MGRRESYSFTNFVAGEALGRLRGGGEIADEVESKAVQGQEENTEHPAVKVMHKTLVLLTRMFLKIVDIVGGLIVRLIKGNSNLSNFMEDVKGESGSKVDFWTWQDSKHGFSRSSTESDVVRLDGDVNDAFEFCREKGLLTLVYLTPVKSGDKNMAENIKTAAGGIAEFDVTGFAVYGARRGTVEGKLAERVLGKAGVKTTIKGVVIAVVAARFDRRTGRGGVKVLAQHHCDPPPGRGETKVWGKVVRKRFKGIVKGMRKEMEERVFERERSEGYERSRGEDERRVREEEEEVRGGEERRLERSDSKSITSPSCITNNLPLVDSLLASSPIPTHSVLRFARRRLRGLGQRRRRGLGGRLRSRKGGLGWLRNFRMNRRWGARALSLLVSCTRGGGRRGLGIKIRTAWRMLSTGAMLCSRLMEGSGRL